MPSARHTRCPYVMDICKAEEPAFADQGGGHFVACHLYPGSRTGQAEFHSQPRSDAAAD